MLKNEDHKFIALCAAIVLFGIIINTAAFAPSIIHKAQMPVTHVDF